MTDVADGWRRAAVPLEVATAILRSHGTAWSMARTAYERVPVEEAIGRVVAVDVRARSDHPNVDDSALDGFACRLTDVAGASPDAPVALRCIGSSRAGRPWTGSVGPGTAVRVQTGSAVPEGASTIVPVEATTEREDAVQMRSAGDPAAIRPRGGDVAAGQAIVPAGTLMNEAHVALASVAGVTSIDVRERLRVALLGGGPEVVGSSATLEPGQVHDANLPALRAMVHRAGAVAVGTWALTDDVEDVTAAWQSMQAEGVDLVVSCGAISMGTYDVVRSWLQRHGRPSFHRVTVKPGGPSTFAEVAGTPWLALPGNPVSAIVTFEILARSWLGPASGTLAPTPWQRAIEAVAGEPLTAVSGKTTLLRVALESAREAPVARLAGDQTSNVLATLAAADGLAIVPPGVTIDEGERVATIPLFA